MSFPVARFLIIAAPIACVSAYPACVLAQASPTYPPLDAVLRINRPHVTIGDESKRGPTLFGGIVDVATDSARNVYVLDGPNRSVRAFTSKGTHLASVGRSGRGPAEFEDPIRLWHDGASTLYVVDGRDGISMFDTRGGKLVYKERFGATLKAVSMCTSRGNVIVAANRADHILHVLSPDRTVARSFGELFRRDTNQLVQAQYNRAMLLVACEESRDRIFVAEGHQNIVRAYDGGGALLWQAVLPEYSGYAVRLDTRNPRAVGLFWGEYSTETIVRVGTDLLVVQARRRSFRRVRDDPRALRTDEHGIVTWVLSASTGRVLTRQVGAPFFIGAAAGDDVIAFTDDPFPQVRLTRVTPANPR